MEKAYEATAFCGTLFLCLCVVLVWSGAERVFGVVFGSARPFSLFKTARVLSRG